MRLGRDYALWLLGIGLHIAIRIFVILCTPFLLFASGFLLSHTRQTRQTSFDLAMLFSLRIARPPHIDWTRLPFMGRRRRATDHGIVSGELLPPEAEEPRGLLWARKRK